MDLQKLLDGSNVEFEIDGETYELRQPTAAERDQAELLASKTERYLRMTDDEIKELAKLPPPDEEIAFYEDLIDYEKERLMNSDDGSADVEAIEKAIRAMRASLKMRTAATAILKSAGAARRNRFLAKRLLVSHEYTKLPPHVQDEIMTKVSEMMDAINNLPFLLEQQQKSQSGLEKKK